MVRNGNNVRLVSESEGMASCARHMHYILLIQLVDNTVGRVRDVVTLSLETILDLGRFCTWYKVGAVQNILEGEHSKSLWSCRKR